MIDTHTWLTHVTQLGKAHPSCQYAGLFCRGVVEISISVFCLKLVRYCMYMWLPMFLEKQVTMLYMYICVYMCNVYTRVSLYVTVYGYMCLSVYMLFQEGQQNSA